MHLVFNAQEVYYADANDGDIINVSFQEYPDPVIDYTKPNFELPPSVKGIFFSRNSELAPNEIVVEWSDGEEEDDGESIKEVILTKTSLKIVLENNHSFNVSFNTDDITYQKLKSFFN